MLPPWYLTRWAVGVWILLGVALVLLVIRARTGALQRQAERLRAKVAEQTAAFAGVELSEQDLEKMELRSRYNAKYPDQVFSEPAIETGPPDYLKTCMNLYNELEAMRND